MKKTTALILLLSSFAFAKAQSPAVDLNWQLQTAQSDEFNGTSINTTMWHIMSCFSGLIPTSCTAIGDYNNGGASGWDATYATESGGYLWLKCDNIDDFCFAGMKKTAGIKSLNCDYNYGYMEIRAQLPGSVDANGAHTKKLWPTFWTFSQEPACHDELDIIDQCCNYYDDGKTTGSGAWAPEPNPCTQNVAIVPWKTHTLAGDGQYLCNSYHKFAAERNTDRIIFYFDDVPWYTTYLNPTVSSANQHAVISLQLSGTGYPFDPATVFPVNYSVDYFNYYTLNTADCGASLDISNNTQLYAYWTPGVPGVRSDITFSGGPTAVTLSSTDKMVFRAVNTITIVGGGGFTVPAGAEFTAVPTPCN